MAPRKPEFPRKMRDEALEWRILIDANDIDAKEQRLFEAWLSADPRHEQAFDRATSVWDAFGELNESRVDPAYFKPTLMHRVREARAHVSLPALGAWGGQWVPVGTGAALAVMLLLLARFVDQAPNETNVERAAVVTHTTGVGETESIRLDDNSVVTLGPASRIDVAMSADARSVSLAYGAAVFDVIHDADRPFSVQADKLTARVLGTVFDVRNNGGVVRLSVGEGVVEASHPFVVNDEPTQVVTRRELRAGEAVAAVRMSGLSKTRSFRAENFAAWRRERLRYVGAPLSELIADANRYSGLPIRLDAGSGDFEDMKVAFSYEVSDIDHMLAALPSLFPVMIDRSQADEIVVRYVE